MKGENGGQHDSRSRRLYLQQKRIFGEARTGNAAVISSGRPVQCSLDADYPFYPDNNFYYLTGLTEPDTLRARSFKNGAGETVEYLFLPEPEPEREKWTGIRMRADEAAALSGIENILPRRELPISWQTLRMRRRYMRAMPDRQYISVLLPAARISEALSLLPASGRRPRSGAPETDQEAVEIDLMKQAVNITARGLNDLLGELHPGMREYEAAAVFEYAVRRAGA